MKRKMKRLMRSPPISLGRRQQGIFNNILQEMQTVDRNSHLRHLRMSKEIFDCLLAQVSR